MAIESPAYEKTVWAFQERPVASAKLNQWDDRIEAALELLLFLLCQGWGGRDGVVRGLGGELAVGATAPASLQLEAADGLAWICGDIVRLKESAVTAPLGAPSLLPRRDLIQVRLSDWNVSVKQGAEAAEPTAPEADAGCLALAEAYLRPGALAILDADDGVNGYIIDRREFV